MLRQFLDCTGHNTCQQVPTAAPKTSSLDSNVWLKQTSDRDAMQPSQETATLVILIFSAPNNVRIRKTIRETWLTDIGSDTLYYFVIGSQGLSDEYEADIRSELEVYSDIILLPNVIDSYKTLTRKLLSSLVYINKNINFRYLLKVDDDSYVQLNKLMHELLQLPYQQRVYWGFFDGRAPIQRKVM